MKTKDHFVVGALLAGAIGAYTETARAAPIERSYQQNAAAYCQGALPAFAGTLRARFWPTECAFPSRIGLGTMVTGFRS